MVAEIRDLAQQLSPDERRTVGRFVDDLTAIVPCATPADRRAREGRAMTESVWDYPRPPRVEATSRRVRVVFADIAGPLKGGPGTAGW